MNSFYFKILYNFNLLNDLINEEIISIYLKQMWDIRLIY